MIEVDDLTKYYGPRAALQNVTFDVQPGEIVGLLGPNGAGKTTAMRIITGFLPATSGSVRVAGYDIAKDSLAVRQRIGYMPETVPLYTDLSVREYLDFMATIRRVPSRLRKQRIEESIALCWLEEYADARIAKLSKGYRQRVGLAQSMIHQPEVLILDEPTIGLDPRQIIETRNLIKSLGGNRTILLSSHILPEVSMICRRVVIIDEGIVIAVDTPESLTRKIYGAERVEVEVRGDAQSVAQTLSAQPQILGVQVVSQEDGRARLLVECEPGSDRREDIAATIISHGWSLLGIRAAGMTLEEIFLKLITKEEIAPDEEDEEDEEA
ncbi:MAG: ATP-binding cassette domain-containing protein [Chloroflexi bacterium]|nr:ATP-binding cassette domain-containing protein [Chloroflexota bacterium]